MSDEGRDKEGGGSDKEGGGKKTPGQGPERRRRRGNRRGQGRGPEESQRNDPPRPAHEERGSKPPRQAVGGEGQGSGAAGGGRQGGAMGGGRPGSGALGGTRPGGAMGGGRPGGGHKHHLPRDQRQRVEDRPRNGGRGGDQEAEREGGSPRGESPRGDRNSREQPKIDRQRPDRGPIDSGRENKPSEAPASGTGQPAGTGPGQARHQGHRRFGRGGRASGPEAAQEARESPLAMPLAEAPLCPICSKPVFDLASAIGADRESGQPAHFDCVYDRVKAAESLGPTEKVVYLGAGAFAVVEFKDGKEGAFVVKRRIQWEKENEKKDWRKAINRRFLGG